MRKKTVRAELIPIPISSHTTPSPTGEGWDEGFKLKIYWDWY
jgi:hypothetical protein